MAVPARAALRAAAPWRLAALPRVVTPAAALARHAAPALGARLAHTAAHLQAAPEADAQAGEVPEGYARVRHSVNFAAQPAVREVSEAEFLPVDRHEPAVTMSDKIALGIVRAAGKLVHFYFGERHVQHACMLETVAAVPGMVGGMLRHLRSLRTLQHDGGWIHTLLEEAENERLHLMTWLEVMQPTRFQRLLIFATQGVFFNAYFLGYLFAPRTCHRLVGYLEEEAVAAYTRYMAAIEAGEADNGPAPGIARRYWGLADDATLLDVVEAVRGDECQHRDVNHAFAHRLDDIRAGRVDPAHLKPEALGGKRT